MAGRGLRGFVCPQGTDEPGRRNEVAYCLGECPRPCVAPPLLAAIYHSNQRNPHKGAYISASMIAGSNCERKVWYERLDADGFYEVPRNTWWPFRGTIAHAVVEERGDMIEHLGWMQEITMSVPLVYPDHAELLYDADGNWTGDFDSTKPLTMTLGGTCDAYNPFTRELYDFKTMADTKAMKVIKSGYVDEAWVKQLNIYAWLISQTKITPAHRRYWKKVGLPPLKGPFFPAPERIAIQGIGMMEIPLTGTSYVPQRERTEYAIEPIPVLDHAEVEAMVRERAIGWFHTLVKGVQPPVVEDDRRWMCKNCTFNGDVIPGERCRPSLADQSNDDDETLAA